MTRIEEYVRPPIIQEKFDMKIILATANRHKIEEIRSVIPAQAGIQILEWLDSRFRGNDIVETGATLLENALQKARAAAKTSGLWALADDTGLFVDALDGRPGIYSARYAGEEGIAVKNIEKLLQELRGVPFEKRGAHFETVMALVHPSGREVTAQGKLEGMIAEKQSGNKGFGYDPVFWLPESRCTLAELSLEEKNKISHRGKALKLIRDILSLGFVLDFEV